MLNIVFNESNEMVLVKNQSGFADDDHEDYEDDRDIIED